MSSGITRIEIAEPFGGHLNTIAETAKRLGVSTFTVRRLVRDGRLKSVRIARRVMIPESAIISAIENGIE